MADIQSLNFKIDIGVTNTKSIRETIDALTELKKFLEGFKGDDIAVFSEMATAFEKFGNACKSLNSIKFDRLNNNIIEVTRNLKKMRQEMESISSKSSSFMGGGSGNGSPIGGGGGTGDGGGKVPITPVIDPNDVNEIVDATSATFDFASALSFWVVLKSQRLLM